MAAVDLDTLIAILVMLAATLVCRFGGFLVMARLPKSHFVDAWLAAIPGAMFTALIATALMRGGFAFWIGAVVVLALRRTKLPLIVILLAGSAAVAAVRLL
jgi:uncharacterized membrane protein